MYKDDNKRQGLSVVFFLISHVVWRIVLRFACAIVLLNKDLKICIFI